MATEQTPKQQTIELIRNAKRIVVLCHQNPDGDAIGSALALTLALRKLGKEVRAICADPVPPTFQFLPATGELASEIESGSSDFVITLDTKNVTVDKLGYKNYPERSQLTIVIKTTTGQLSPDVVSFNASGAAADLLLVLDTNDIERLGNLYGRYTQLFYDTPIVNIDHHPGNDYFGKVNWVDLGATSTAEILVALLEALSALPRADGQKTTLLDPDIATLLLTGITTDTGSFQNTNTTPKSFTVAAQLVAAGARQQEIVQYIYKTKSLSTLKLWGKILGNIREERDARFIYSTVAGTDFSTFGAGESETSGVVDELLKTVPNIDFALLLSEKREGLYGSLRGVSKNVSVAEIAKLFGGGGHEMAAAFRIPNGSLVDNEADIISKIRDFQRTGTGGAGLSQVPASRPVTSLPFENAAPTSSPSLVDESKTPATMPGVPDLDALKAKQASIQA